MRARRIANRRQAHKTLYAEPVLCAAIADETCNIGHRHACFLRFVAGVYLYEKTGFAPALRHGARQCRSQFGPVQTVNNIEQANRFRRLVALQSADEMQLHIGIGAPQARPFPGRFLHAVFAKNAVPRLKHRRDGFCAMCFRHGNQRNVVRRAIAFSGKPGQFGLNGLQAFRCGSVGCVFHLAGHINLSMQESFNTKPCPHKFRLCRRRSRDKLFCDVFHGKANPISAPVSRAAFDDRS